MDSLSHQVRGDTRFRPAAVSSRRQAKVTLSTRLPQEVIFKVEVTESRGWFCENT